MPDRFYADEWLPSRFSLGVLRLTGYVIATTLRKERPSSGAYLNRDPQQHPLQAILLSLAYWLIPSLHIALLAAAAFDPDWIVAPLTFAMSLVVVPFVWVLLALVASFPVKVVAKVTGRTRNVVQSLVTALGMAAIAVCSIVFEWPGAALGWIWVGLVAMELIASLVCLPLRGRFAELDRGLPSEAP